MDGDTSWRPPPILIILFLLSSGFILYINVIQTRFMDITRTITMRKSQPSFVGYLEKNDGFLIKTEGCRIPYMDPFDVTILKHISTPKQFVCNKHKPPLIESNCTTIQILNTSLSAYGIQNLNDLICCYSSFHRIEPRSSEGDNQVSYNNCVQFNQSATIKDEFIRVSCTLKKKEIYKDFFSFVPIKHNLVNFSINSNEILNVLIIGLDAVSRLNLHRQMPKTVQMLNKIGALEYLGYNKVADNTFPNLVPILIGLSEDELIKTCWHKKSDKFDECNFLWKNYSKNGYATFFGEDSTWMGIFNYLKKGFKKQPTDYYWGPFDYVSEKQIGNAHDMNVFQCIGSRAVYQVMLDYILTSAKVMTQHRIPYFSLFWGGSLSHDYLNKPKLGDDSYARFFNELEKSNVLKNTVLFFISDHGIRWGDIRGTYQGRMEERLPFLFIALPKQYRDSYYQINTNLIKNSQRLTTPFDLHETLKDLLNPYTLDPVFTGKRFGNTNKTRRGYSFFEPIPTNRTCESAGISSHWCTCQQSTAIDANNSVVIEASNFVVTYMNKLLIGYAECANLTLAKISDARIHTTANKLKDSKVYFEDYTIRYSTTPGDGNFETTIRHSVDKKFKKNKFNVVGTISRTNLYGNQSVCMTDFHLKLYCYCIT